MSFQGVSRTFQDFQGHFSGVSQGLGGFRRVKFYGALQEVSGTVKGHFNVFQGAFREVLRGLRGVRGGFKEDSGVSGIS